MGPVQNLIYGESESPSFLSDSLRPHGLYSPWNSPGQNTGMGSCSFLQGIFPTQGSNPGFLHCRQVLYLLSHKESPRILEWVAYPFSSGSSRWRNGNRILLHCRQIFYQLSYQGSPGIKHQGAQWFHCSCEECHKKWLLEPVPHVRGRSGLRARHPWR